MIFLYEPRLLAVVDILPRVIAAAAVGRNKSRLLGMAACLWCLATAAVRAEEPPADRAWEWTTASPESQRMDSAALELAWVVLKDHHTTAFLVIRHDRIVFERYAPGHGRTKPHNTASLAKALVAGTSLMVAMHDGRISPDDPAHRYVLPWRDDPKRRQITVRHLASHTSGIEDAEADSLPHDSLTGWKGDFWKRLPPPRDPFTLARDVAPVVDMPGTKERYSNPGMAMLGYCVTASLRGTDPADLRSLLEGRILRPLGVPAAEWSVGYGSLTTVDGLVLVATWGGGSYSPNAVARVGRLMLRKGDWEGRRLVSPSVIEKVAKPSGMPGHSGLGWWVNSSIDGTKLWKSAPEDAFGGAGAGQQFLLVVPSLDLIVVRNGQQLDLTLTFEAGLDRFVVGPVVRAISTTRKAPYPPSPVIRGVHWAPKESIVRRARGSDTWPLTWADDDALYTAYGDGYGFEPSVPNKLSLGIAKIVGPPEDFTGINIRSATGERQGDGAKGQKASGMLMVDGVIYMLVRNSGNSQLAWSSDHGKTWTWSGWRFASSFGCPTLLSFGKNHAGARDDYVYIYSQDDASAYRAADRMVLARVPKGRITERERYEFFESLGHCGIPLRRRLLLRPQSDLHREGMTEPSVARGSATAGSLVQLLSTLVVCDGHTGPSSQRSPTPASRARCGGSPRAAEEAGVQKIWASEMKENSVNVAVQITTLIPAITTSVGTTAFGPPAKTSTGQEVRTIVRLRSADLRTTLRRLGAADTFS
jgi:CubicO group peptidase (beta-lactamase class C family)